jgi:hypothetical protein
VTLMARARKRSRRRARKRAARAVSVSVAAKTAAAPRAPTPASPPPRAGADAEARLLSLAREVAAIPARVATPREAVCATIDHLVEAWQPTAPLPAAVFAAWNSTRGDDGRALALAFAREQVALGVREVLEAALKAGDLRDDLPAEAMAWLVTSACESMAHGGDGAERTRWILAACARR